MAGGHWILVRLLNYCVVIEHTELTKKYLPLRIFLTNASVAICPRSCMLSTLINELTCGHWTTVAFIELLIYIELTKKLICTCSPTLVLTKGTKAHQRKVSSARLIVYTAHFIRAGLIFLDRVPVLSVLGLPLDIVRARVKFWSGTDGPKSFTRLNLSVPNQFFWYAYFFHPSRAKNFRPCKWG